jgi:hypothetical protein
MALKRYSFLLICIFSLAPLCLLAQTGDSGRVISPAHDTGNLKKAGGDTGIPRALDTLGRQVHPHRDTTGRAARLATARRRDSTFKADSVLMVVKADSLRRDSLNRDSLSKVALLAAQKPKPPQNEPLYRPDTKPGVPKIHISKDLLFYILLAMFLWIAILKSGYEKYYNDLFTVFFRSSLRQHQIREQLLQARLPSLMYNLFFVASAGTFLFLLASYYEVHLRVPQWQIWMAAVACVALLYGAKFVGLKLSGWIFGMSGAADTYIFIVFLVNKILGVALLPILAFLAFAREPLRSVSATLGLLLIFGMLIYRFIRSYRPVWEEVQMSRFHFFLYLCAFEIAPLLLIYKTISTIPKLL